MGLDPRTLGLAQLFKLTNWPASKLQIGMRDIQIPLWLVDSRPKLASLYVKI